MRPKNIYNKNNKKSSKGNSSITTEQQQTSTELFQNIPLLSDNNLNNNIIENNNMNTNNQNFEQDWIESNFDEQQLSINDEKPSSSTNNNNIPTINNNSTINSNNTTSSIFGDDNDFTNSFQFQFAKSMIQSTTSKVVPTWFSFSFMKPYFNMFTERELIQRMIKTVFLPFTPMNDHVEKPDLYIPLLAVFILSILFNFQMKFSLTTQVGEATVLGSSLFASFIYWIVGSGLFYLMGLVLGSELTMIPILCLTGYQLLPICLIQFSSLFYFAFSKGNVSSTLFYILYFTIGLCGSLNFGRTFMVKVRSDLNQVVQKTNGLIMMVAVFAIHMIYIFWVSSVFQATEQILGFTIGNAVVETTTVKISA
ncbi:hypothetical protein ABK040_006431 [Willaertia magna]